MTTVGVWLTAHADLDRRDREVLLRAAAGVTRAQILSRPETPLVPAVEQQLNGWAGRRRQGEPLAYLTGCKEFWGLEFDVSADVLVPRPETELLVEQALELAAEAPSRPVGILELGTGSGAIAIALATAAPRLGLPVEITATDVSTRALAVAERNGSRHRVDVRWRVSDWYRQVPGRFHVIVSNPPYVRAGDPHLTALGHEPALALVGGADGLDAIRSVVAGARRHLHHDGRVVLEHGFDQGAAVRDLLREAGFADARTLPDLAGLDRVTRASGSGT